LVVPCTHPRLQINDVLKIFPLPHSSCYRGSDLPGQDKAFQHWYIGELLSAMGELPCGLLKFLYGLVYHRYL
jgi:hypothetical protein